MYQTDMYEGMVAETITMHGANGDVINAYFARPLGAGPFPGMVLIHHLPGWDEWYREATRKFAHHGYLALSPNLYFREGHGTPEDVAAQVRAAGGVADEQAMGDVEGAMRYLRSLPTCNGKVGVFGTCSGGRQTVLVASRVPGFDAAGSTAPTRPPSTLTRWPLSTSGGRLARTSLDTEAMLGSASPRNPMLAMRSRSSRVAILLVAWRESASTSSPAGIPKPLSRTRIRRVPPDSSSIPIVVAAASSAFSISSLTTEAGRSTTSPAAI